MIPRLKLIGFVLTFHFLQSMLFSGISFSQVKHKKDVYIFFKPDSLNGIIKIHSGENTPNAYDGFLFYRNLDKRGKVVRFGYSSIVGDQSWCADADILRKTKKINQLIDMPGFGYDTQDKKRYPFRNVYIVEYISPNKYKVIKVQSYISSDFY